MFDVIFFVRYEGEKIFLSRFNLSMVNQREKMVSYISKNRTAEMLYSDNLNGALNSIDVNPMFYFQISSLLEKGEAEVSYYKKSNYLAYAEETKEFLREDYEWYK